MKYQGMVISMAKDKAIVTTSDFQCFFIKRSPTIYLGKHIEFSEKDIIKKRSVLSKMRYADACKETLFSIKNHMSNFADLTNIKKIYRQTKVFAYIDIDINTSLGIEIDDVGKILRLVPLNEDGNILKEKLKLRNNRNNINISQFINLIISELKESKEISGSGINYMLISSALNSKKSESSKEYQTEKNKLDILVNSLKDKIQNEENGNVNVFLIQTKLIERKEAQSKGVSTGRYILYNDCKNLRNDFSMEDAKKFQVNELLEYLLPNKPNNVRAMTLDKQEYSDQTKVPVGTPTQSTHTKI